MMTGVLRLSLLLGVFIGAIRAETALAKGQACTLKAFEQDKPNMEIEETRCVQQFKTKDCLAFAESFNRSLLPPEFQLDDSHYSIERPAQNSMSLEPFDFEYKIPSGVTQFYPGVSIVFGPPVADLSRAALKGYLVIWETPGVRTSCRLFKFDPDTQLEVPKDIRYRMDLNVVKEVSDYRVRVYSMPPPAVESSMDDQTYATMMFRSHSISNDTNPGEWYPSLVPMPRNDGTFSVKISRPPKMLNITKFTVMLVKPSVDPHNAFMEKSIVIDADDDPDVVTFTGLSTDVYYIVVRVIDTYPRQDGKCVCWVQEPQGRHCLISCGSVRTLDYNVTGSVKPTAASYGQTSDLNTTVSFDPALETTEWTDGDTTMTSDPAPEQTGGVKEMHQTSDGDDDGLMVAVPVCLSVAVLAIVGACLLFYYKRRRQTEGSSIYSVEKHKSEKQVSKPHLWHPVQLSSKAELSIKTVFLVFAEGNPAHMTFVEYLAKFLKVHCQCDVIYHPWEDVLTPGPRLWTRTSFDRADHVLFIDSVPATMLLAGYSIRQAVFNIDPHTNQHNLLFRYAWEHLERLPGATDNVVMLHYTDECFSQGCVVARYQMQLLKDFPELLKLIHGLSSKQAQENDHALPMEVKNFTQLPEGYDLVKAVQEAERCSDDDPAWFRLRYGGKSPEFGTQQSVGSAESGVYSISGSRSTSGAGSVSNQDLSSIGKGETSPPVSWFDGPNFTHQRQQEAVESRLGHSPPSPEVDESSIVTFGTNVLNNGYQTEGSSVVAPFDSVSAFNGKSFSNHVRNINSDAWSDVTGASKVLDATALPQYDDGCVGQGFEPGDDESQVESRSMFERSLRPPAQSTVDVDSFSAALRNFNEEEEEKNSDYDFGGDQGGLDEESCIDVDDQVKVDACNEVDSVSI